MKHIFKFPIQREVVKEKPVIKKNKKGEEYETTQKTKTKQEFQVKFRKPTMEEREMADFFYGRKVNEFIGQGFKTKAMMVKLISDVGGLSTDEMNDEMRDMVLQHIEARKVIELFDGAKDLSKEDQERLDDAKSDLTTTQMAMVRYEEAMRSQFANTADQMAENELIRWLVLNFSYYSEKQGEKEVDFPMFKGAKYEDKKKYLFEIEDLEDQDEIDPEDKKVRDIMKESYIKLVRIAAIWYQGYGDTQESIQKAIDEFYKED